MKDKPTPSDIGSVRADPVPFRFLSTATGSQWIERLGTTSEPNESWLEIVTKTRQFLLQT